MTERQMLNLVGHWQEFLGLDHWLVGVDFSEPADNNANATIFRMNDYDKATLYLHEGWKTWDSQWANEIIAHELLHLVTRDLEHAFDSVEAQVPAAVWEALDHRFQHELEGVIDRLSIKFVELANS